MLAAPGQLCLGSHFCLSLVTEFQPGCPLPLASRVDGCMSFSGSSSSSSSFIFFYLPPLSSLRWGIELAFLCGGLFCFIFGESNFELQGLEKDAVG